MNRLQLMPPLLMLLFSSPHAQEPSTKISLNTHSNLRPSTALSDNKAVLAQQWGLQEEEFDRFQSLMQGPLGTYSPNLDPLSALGIEARTDVERQRYARLQVDAEARRVEKLLAYQQAYDQAWKDRHPAMPLVNPPPMSSPLMIKTTGRKVVFVQYDCPECEHRVRRLQASGAAFDLYLIDSKQNDNRIRQWAQKVGIKPAKIRDGTITINHDNGRWVSIGDEGDLPAVMHEVNGEWQRQ
ncbi:TIGR03759 family integrating conjugative element protein [Pseudomonas sp. P105]|uniref:TIGR03759 family integrating conjugative element protein n=1 Tax=unclassified Pseudomonas TaxID=196821 RepID=UPI00293429BA|nr:TIGR03759 family integrating conjugative element protein [Pseudomonas sp. P105]WNZ76392.1 TIGR03759 family integrating conjugative element protein [Pseudomonas sp. P105]